MWPLLVPICLAIFSSSLSLATEPHFVITVPVNLAQGTEEKACVTFLDLKGAVDLKLELKKDEEVHLLAEHKIQAGPDHSECYSFKVPVIEEKNSVWLLHVTAHGDDINWDKSEKVFISKQNACIVQTDKYIYKPGDIVRFRLITVDSHLRVEHKIHPLVEISDPNKHRIAQWLDVSSNNGFTDFSFHLAIELSLGEYKIDVPHSCETTFKVEEYVLKRFEVNINSPPSVAVIDKTFHLEVCGRYTYGKPVEGSIDLFISIKERFFRRGASSDSSSEEDEDEFSGIIIRKAKTNSKGCVLKDVDLGLFNFSKSERSMFLEIKSSLTEDHTGHIEKASADVKLNLHKNVQFIDKQHIYRKGFLYHAKVKVTDEKDKPMSNQAVQLYLGHYFSFKKSDEAQVTDENGIAYFTLNTSTWDTFITLMASLSSIENDDEDYNDHMYSNDPLMVVQFHSLSESQLFIKGQSNTLECNSDETVTVEYEIQRKALDSDTDHLHVISLLRSEDGIILYKEHKIDIKDQSNNPTVHGSFPVSFHVDEKVYPRTALVVFSVLPNGETIAMIAPYDKTPLCLKKKVQLKFSEEQVLPGASVNLEVSANAGSLCSIRSVDKGHLLQNPYENSLESQYKELLQSLQTSLGSIRMLDDLERHQCPENETAETELMPFLFDVNMLFKAVGIRIFTNTHIKKPVKCVPSQLGARSGTKTKKTGAKDKEIPERFTRRYFPDNWLFEVVPVGSEGHTVLNRTTPHSITKWVTDAFCLDKTGIAIASDVELTTFQLYFIDLIVPYSVVQGEKFTIQAVVFNYVKKCILIVVSLADSEDFATVKNKEQARCVCEGHSHSFTWDVTAVKPKTLQIHVDSGSLEVDGTCTEDPLLIRNDQRKDSVEKTIVVKPRGHEEEKTQAFLLYPSESKEDVHITLDLPERLVAGSERAHIIIQGDIMANIIANLEYIVHLPDGCGEQNSAKLSRYVYTLEYLESIKELTPEKKAKATESLMEAYQKQLTFASETGSYGFFYGSTNLWVTAFVVKTYINAQKWIYIEEKSIQQSVEWLQSQQLPDGCFRAEGDPFNNALEADNEVAHAAYVVIALLEHPREYAGSIVENALSCLKKSVDRDTSVYTQALLAYAFTLSGDSELRDQILKKLDASAITKEGTKHWETKSCKDSIETESYIVLALLSDKTTTAKHLEESANIIRWIVSWQNPYGGFQSSQDTTVALQALTKFARATTYKKGESTVTINSKSGFRKTVHVDKSNSLLVQTVDLPEIPGEYTVSTAGDGSVYIQSHIHYHTLPDESEKGHFSLNVSTTPSVCTQESQRKFDIHVDVRYSGKRENTNMAIIIIEPVSGYTPDKNSLRKLKKNPAVKKTEVSAEKISIYLDKLTHESESFVFSLEQETHVENLQPATAVAYDYYFPDEHTVVEYNAPCSVESKKIDNH